MHVFGLSTYPLALLLFIVLPGCLEPKGKDKLRGPDGADQTSEKDALLDASQLMQAGQAIPINSYLADSPWPMSHRNPYAQASSPLAGPTSKNGLNYKIARDNPGIITLNFSPKYSNGARVVWGASITTVFKIDANGRKWDFIDRKLRLQSPARAISGAYSLVDKDGIFYLPRNKRIEAYGDSVRGDASSNIKKIGSYTLEKDIERDDDEMIVGLNLTYDGMLAFVTSHGNVGVVTRDFTEPKYLQLPKGEMVANSIAVDEDGGIYIVTDKNIHRVQWDKTKLTVAWTVPYPSDNNNSLGRLGEGSGTTPTLLGTGNDDKLLAIADGQDIMHITYVWRDQIPSDWSALPNYDRRVAAVHPISFGQTNPTQATTEQSLIGVGHDVIAVSNDYGSTLAGLSSLSSTLTIFFSNFKKVAPHGMERFSWDPASRKLVSVWANKDVSCPNSIPTLSLANGLIYCIGARDRQWTLEAVRFDNGQSHFSHDLGKSILLNSYYAATEIGENGRIVSGAFGGPIVID